MRLLAATIFVGATLVGCTTPKPLQVATGLSAHILCTQVFVGGQDANAVFNGYIRQIRGMKLIGGALSYRVNRADRSVTARFAGSAPSRAVFKDGRGCTVVRREEDPEPLVSNPAFANAPDPIAAPAGPVTTTPAALNAALDVAFEEPKGGPIQAVKAIVILHDGKIVAERYAPGYGPNTAIHSWSIAKSVANALIGILQRSGRLDVDRPAPVAAWQNPADPRHAITIDQLLRQTSGQPFGSSNNGFDRSSQMMFTTPNIFETSANAEFSAPPGSAWSYTDGNFAILSGILAQTIGGGPQGVHDFAQRELFGMLAMASAQIEFDEVGTPNLAAFVTATARDWARFGELFRRDGVIDGKRILPEGWVERSARPTPVAGMGYGAGFWTNLGDSLGARTRRSWGAPPESFFANGDYGQTILIAPKQKLVIARFGFSQGNAAVNMRRTLALAVAVMQALEVASLPSGQHTPSQLVIPDRSSD